MVNNVRLSKTPQESVCMVRDEDIYGLYRFRLIKVYKYTKGDDVQGMKVCTKTCITTGEGVHMK